jgi:hypothetical protein
MNIKNMTKQVKLLIATMPSLLFFTVSFCQYYHKGDYVITLNNDTVFGTIRREFVGNTFNIRNADSVYVYAPGEIDAYYSGQKNTLYKRRKLPGSTMQFIACAEIGKINLYLGYTSIPAGGPGGMPVSYSTGTGDAYLEKQTGVLVRIRKSKTFGKPKIEKEIFLSMIDDVPGIKEKYLEDEVQGIFDISYYIHEYNRKVAEIKN